MLIGGQDLPAQVLKMGSLETVDLALLSIDQSQLPASLQLRRNPLCKTFPSCRAKNGRGLSRSNRHPNFSPQLHCALNRASHGSLIKEEQSSGSGVFIAEQQCLRALSAKKYEIHLRQGIWWPGRHGNGWPDISCRQSAIAEFIPPAYRY